MQKTTVPREERFMTSVSGTTWTNDVNLKKEARYTKAHTHRDETKPLLKIRSVHAEMATIRRRIERITRQAKGVIKAKTKAAKEAALTEEEPRNQKLLKGKG